MVKWLLIIFSLFQTIDTIGQQSYALVSYLNIKVDSLGNLPANPYIVQLKNKGKYLIVVGTQHSRDTLSAIYAGIENAFNELQPQVIINEGGNLTKHYLSRTAAILTDGELGLEKFLADQSNLKTVSGDEPDKQEFMELSQAYSKDEALLFFASERFIFPYVFGQLTGTLEAVYDSNFIQKYMLKEGIHLTPQEQTFAYYRKLYEKYFKKEFSLDNISQLDFTPFGTRHHFNEVTRKSKELRDTYLLKQIEVQLTKHDRVLVVYGGWHVLAIEPALSQIIKNIK